MSSWAWGPKIPDADQISPSRERRLSMASASSSSSSTTTSSSSSTTTSSFSSCSSSSSSRFERAAERGRSRSRSRSLRRHGSGTMRDAERAYMEDVRAIAYFEDDLSEDSSPRSMREAAFSPPGDDLSGSILSRDLSSSSADTVDYGEWRSDGHRHYDGQSAVLLSLSTSSSSRSSSSSSSSSTSTSSASASSAASSSFLLSSAAPRSMHCIFESWDEHCRKMRRLSEQEVDNCKAATASAATQHSLNNKSKAVAVAAAATEAAAATTRRKRPTTTPSLLPTTATTATTTTTATATAAVAATMPIEQPMMAIQETFAKTGFDFSLLGCDIWGKVSKFLPDSSVLELSSASGSFHKTFDENGIWKSRAASLWATCPFLLESEKKNLAEHFEDEGRAGHFRRRSLLKGKKVKIMAQRPDMLAMGRLVHLMGGSTVAVGFEADIVLVHLTPHRARSVSPWCWWRNQALKHPDTVFMSSWLPASLVAGRLLPSHRSKCASTSSAFSLSKSCIAYARTDASGCERHCCFAPRLLEGMLITTNCEDRSQAIQSMVTALGGHYTHEMTRDHTHLIAEQIQGLKIEFAHAHRIVVVNTMWLETTVRILRPMQERCFPLRGYEPDF